MSNDTVMIRLQKDTYGRGFNLESGVVQGSRSGHNVLPSAAFH